MVIKMKTGKNYKFWFATGSQDLYGDECLRKVAEHSRIIVEGLNQSGLLPYEVVWKPTLITNEVIRKTFNDANADAECAGVITWMHTFSPAKSWILGLQEYRKPLMHFHTQFNEEIPYDTIDMDFMNENQSAHGDREYGHIVSRMGIERKVVVGYWKNPEVIKKIAQWMVTAVGVMESSHIRVCRFGDNMNNVAVTEGDKVEAQIKFGWEIDHYNVNDLVEYVDAVPAGDISTLTDEYYSKYQILLEGRDAAEFRKHVEVQAAIEIGLEKFLTEHDYHAVVTHFGMLGGLKQLPGLAIQRLMEKGYGFGAEGDWKTAAISSSVTNVNCVGVLAIISGCNRISSTFHSPTNSAFSGSRNASFGKPNVSVRSAWIIESGSFLRLSSPNRPEGMSIETMVASDWLIYLTIAAKPPVKGRFKPEPNKPSITTSRSSSSGGTKSSTTSVNSIFSMWSNRCLFISQSSERRMVGLNR